MVNKKVDFNTIIWKGLSVGLTLSQVISLMDVAGVLKDLDVGLLAIHPSDMAFLEDNEFIKVNDGLVSITKSGRKIVAMRRDFSTLTAQLRGLFPVGMKDGKWPWRSTPSVIKQRLEDFEKMYPDITDDEILLATKNYLATFNDDKSRSLLIYFIYKDIDGRKRSILAEHVHAYRESPVAARSSEPIIKYNQI